MTSGTGTGNGAGGNGTDELFPRPRAVVAPGAVHVPGWLSPERQRELVTVCRSWAAGPVPMRHTRLPRGGVMSVQTVCVGWHWQPYRYTRAAEDVNGERVVDFPDWLGDLGREAVAAAYDGVPGAESYTTGTYVPDTALVNFYDGDARMGMHQDKDEKSLGPVVSLSIGNRCVFRFGNTENRGRPYTDVELGSGDLFVFGGPSRLSYHAVPKVYPGTAGAGSGMSGGRLNITLRETGLA